MRKVFLKGLTEYDRPSVSVSNALAGGASMTDNEFLALECAGECDGLSVASMTVSYGLSVVSVSSCSEYDSVVLV